MKILSFSLLLEMCVCKRPVPPLLPYHESYPHSIIILVLNWSQHCFYLSQVVYGGQVETILSAETPAIRQSQFGVNVGEKSWRYLSTEKSNKHVLIIVLRFKCWLCDNCGLYSINPIWALLPKYWSLTHKNSGQDLKSFLHMLLEYATPH